MDTEIISDVIDKLPPDLQAKVYRYPKKLLTEPIQTRQSTLSQNWAEMLKDCNYKSVELQHISNSWRIS